MFASRINSLSFASTSSCSSITRLPRRAFRSAAPGPLAFDPALQPRQPPIYGRDRAREPTGPRFDCPFENVRNAGGDAEVGAPRRSVDILHTSTTPDNFYLNLSRHAPPQATRPIPHRPAIGTRRFRVRRPRPKSSPVRPAPRAPRRTPRTHGGASDPTTAAPPRLADTFSKAVSNHRLTLRGPRRIYVDAHVLGSTAGTRLTFPEAEITDVAAAE